MILAAGVILVVRLWLALTVLVPIGVDQVNIFGDLSLPLWQIALIGWLESLTIVFLGYKWLKNQWIVLVLACSPWVNALTIFNIWTGLIVIGVGIVLSSKKIVGILLGVAIVLIAGNFSKGYFLKISDNNLRTQLNSNKLAEEVDLVQKNNFLATGKTYILPAAVRKIVYNKATLALQKIVTKAVSLLDLEQASAPLSAWTLTGMSGIPPKGVLPLIYFWEVIFILLWAVNLKHGLNLKYWLVGGIALISMLYFDKKFLDVSGVGMIFLIAGAISIGLSRVSSKALKQGIIILYLVAAGHMLYKTYYTQDNYRYSDAKLYWETAKFIKNNSSEKFVVTDRFGPMEKMLKWYQVPTSKIEVRQFKIADEKSVGSIYIGLPKEMSGYPEEKLLEKITANDELVYGFGKGVWIGKL